MTGGTEENRELYPGLQTLQLKIISTAHFLKLLTDRTHSSKTKYGTELRAG